MRYCKNLAMRKKIKGIISDMDGVIYRGKELIPGAQDLLS